jgi:hypothetical protein
MGVLNEKRCKILKYKSIFYQYPHYLDALDRERINIIGNKMKIHIKYVFTISVNRPSSLYILLYKTIKK